jgi:hypothetical protein
MNHQMICPSQGERDFSFHFGQETLTHNYQGPAHTWLEENRIPPAAMTVFGYWEQRNNDRWFNQLLDDDAPPFRVPWSSAEDFFVRVRELLELYPEVKYLTADRPRQESFSGVFEGTTTDVRQD